MVMRPLLLFMAVFFILCLPASSFGKIKKLTILYTGSVSGELEPCGCSPKTDFGGVTRRAGFISGHVEELSPFLLIDAGNFTGEDTPQGRLKAKAMVRALRVMGYDAVALLGRERGFSGDYLLKLFREYSVPAVSPFPPWKRSILVKKGAVTVNISVDPGGRREGYLNILLTDLAPSELGHLKGWDVMILSAGDIIDEPIATGDTIMVSGYPSGERLGILSLEVGEGGRVSDFVHRWEPLGIDTGEDSEVRAIMDEYDRDVSTLLKSEYAPPDNPPYVGVARCKECHQPFVDSWEGTRHAMAFPSLERVGKAGDPECIRCHTVGFGEEGGFYSAETTPGLKNVQCEACHGHGSEHILDFYAPMQPVIRSLCLKCHTERQSPDFDYNIYLEKVRH